MRATFPATADLGPFAVFFYPAVEASVLSVELVRPVVDPLYPANNNYVFDSSAPGKCRVSCIVKVTPDTPEIRSQLQGKLKWSIESVPGSTLTWQNGGTSGGVGVYDSAFGDWRETAIFTGLPTDNSSFGDKVATLEYEGNTYEGLAQIFYTKDALNHPGAGSGTIPNWYYYWSQTAANSGSHTYGGNVPGLAGSVPYTGPNAGDIFIYDGASSTGAGYFPQFQSRTYIDSFASVVRHEIKHQSDFYANWNPYSLALDADANGGPDLLKDSVESSLTGMNGSSYDNTKRDTNGDGVKDGEDYASTAENSWTVGSADDEDWASPGNNSTK